MFLPGPKLRFDAFVLDPAGRRFLRDDVPVALEPKAFEVLALLASAPGRAFTRDEILDAVWGHRHVTPGVLNRIMTLLRHALGEEANAPRYLHTLHGVGYRFDLPSAPVPSAGPTPVAARELDLPTADGGASDTTASRSDAPFDGIERRRTGPLAPPKGTALHAARMALVLGGVMALAALGAWAWNAHHPAPAASSRHAPPQAAPGGTTTTPAANRAEPTLVVMPLRPIGADPSTRDLAAGLSDELITELARVQGLRVIARESTSLAAAESQDMSRLVARLGISHALEGSLARVGEHLRVRLRLIDLRDGRTLWAQDYDRAATDALQLQRDVARAVADTLALNLGLAGNAPARGNVAFLRRYYAARAKLNDALPGEQKAADLEAEFRAMVREQPRDGRSHAGLAAALEVHAFFTPVEAAAMRAEAAREADLALHLDPDLADALRVQAAGACRADQWDRCLRLYERGQSLAPGEARPLFNYAQALAALGYLDRAEAVMRAGADSDPLNQGWMFGQARLLDTLGRHEDAARVLQAVDKGTYGKWFNAVWRHDLPGALRVAQSLDARTGQGQSYEAMLRPAYIAVSEALADPRRWPEARQRMRETEQKSGLVNFLRVFEPDAPPAQLIAGLEEVRHRSYSTWDLLLWTRDLAPLRRDPAFADYLKRSGILAYWRRNGFPRQCRAVGDGAACD